MGDGVITLQFSTTWMPASALIRARSWCNYSHTAFVLDDGTLFGALFTGVQKHSPSSYTTRTKRYGVNAPQSVLDRALSQEGKSYDWTADFGIIFHRDWHEEDSWQCAELVAWAFWAEGYPLLRADHLNRIMPADLLLSPYLLGVE